MKNVTRLLCVLGFLVSVVFAESLGETQKKTESTEIIELRQKAEAGHAESQVKLAVNYRYANPSESARWWRAAAEQGHLSAQFNLAEYLRQGRGVAKDVYEAIEWYTKAAKSGHLLSQYDLGYLFWTGKEIPEDRQLAFKWIAAAATQGSAEAQNRLGQFYFDGFGVPKDMVEAIKWYTKAAEQNHLLSQAILGEVYLAGEGVVAKNLVEAHVWFNLATAAGLDQSAERSTAEKQMTREQIAEATKLAKERFERYGNKK
jgi:TPR repeat protein